MGKVYCARFLGYKLGSQTVLLCNMCCLIHKHCSILNPSPQGQMPAELDKRNMIPRNIVITIKRTRLRPVQAFNYEARN